MRYRFSARTREGEPRNGLLEAADKAVARAQLERRGLTLESLEEDGSDVPRHVVTRDFTAGPPPPEKPAHWWQSIDWKHLDKRKLGWLALVLLACLAGGFFLLRWALSDRNYHLHLTGQVKILSRKPVQADIYDKLTPRLWLPQLRWVVSNKGEVWSKDSKGTWQKLSRRASFVCKFGAEGVCTIDVKLAMPIAPERAMLYFPAGRFRRTSRQFTFRIRNNVFEGEVPGMTLVARKRGKK
ncbi:MAG: hypothetical protein KF760_18925 [Candidatus Eremiobacteraeota bacterium]|nr:hypothetical protein [Candidatus Eremiobacteraeota bacterium]MCW5868473.1 hypothetical protein [Candidatus Eremiobacteraeota bacterium]